ncbi:MAG: M16 family metallopeptidase [Candidatus Gastranaerophilaceae bacterium]
MKKFLLVLACVLIGNFVFAQNVFTYKLDNGQTVVVEQVKNNPIVTIDTWIRTGSINEDDSNNGISHFLEHLFFKGTEKNPTGTFDKLLESKGAITNAATSKDFTHYYITISSKYFDKALELHADMLLNPQIPRNEMEKERKVVLEEIAKDANSPANICYENLNKLLYTTHPYKRKVIGSSKVVENVTRETILDYYKKYYTPSNMTTVIVGDVEPSKALEIVKKNFNAPYKKTLVSNYKKEKLLSSQKRNITYMPTQAGYMMIGFRGADISENDNYALDVLATILGNGRSSKLYQSLKEQKQLVNSISVSNATMKDDGVFIINSNFVPQNAQKVESAIFTEIEKIKEFGISDTDLKIAKKTIETDTYYSRESASNIAQEMGYTITLTGDIDYYNNYLNKINKVTSADVKRVANKYLTKNNSAVSLVLPEEKETNNISNKKTTCSAILVSSNDTTEKYKLNNNATLLITDNKYNDIVAISLMARGGNFLEQQKGTSRLFADLLLKGTKKYSAVELAELLEENGIKLTFNPTSDTFNIGLQTTKNQVQTALEILDDILNNSSFDDIEIEKDRTLLLNKIKQNRDIPLNLAIDGYKSKIYNNSVYTNSYEQLEKNIPLVTRENIKKYQKDIFNPNNIIISVNGDIDKELLINKFGSMFRTNIEQSKFDYKKYSIPKLSTQTQVIKNADKQQTAWVILGWQTDGVTNLKDYATLEVMNTILGSGMSSRLFKSIREQEGLAYQVGSSFQPKILAGSFNVYVGTNPKTQEHAKQKMLAEINKFKTQFVSDKELQDAKDRLLGEFVIALETNSDKAAVLAWFEASDRGYNFIDEYQNLINSVTVSDIIEVANKYFKNNYVTSIVTTK